MPNPLPQVYPNHGQDILHCFHAARAAHKAASRAAALGDEELSQLYRDQASWRIALAMRYGSAPCGAGVLAS